MPSLELAKTGALRIIITIRRIEDALASWVEAFETLPDTVVIEIMRRWLHMFHELRGLSLVVSYRQIDNRPWFAAWRISRTVCRNIGPMEVLRIARSLDKAKVKRRVDRMELGEGVHDAGWTYYDTATFFHRRHISDVISHPAEKRLPPNRLARFRDLMRNDLVSLAETREKEVHPSEGTLIQPL
jgi:hypothetical protein